VENKDIIYRHFYDAIYFTPKQTEREKYYMYYGNDAADGQVKWQSFLQSVQVGLCLINKLFIFSIKEKYFLSNTLQF
jgi:hypothetical protein